MLKQISYKGWENCYKLSNDIVDLIITGDVGPRVIRFGFVGDVNEFKEYEDMVGKVGGDDWRIYGGHRLWHGPEEKPRTYFPDNFPVIVEESEEFVKVIQPIEPTTGIQKEMDIYLAPDKPEVKIVHRLRNENLWSIELAAWALSVMRPGGKAIIPFPPRGTHEENLLPTNTVTMWAYTNFSDPRWLFMEKYLILKQDPQKIAPQKAGLMCKAGWCAYWNDKHLFVKQFEYKEGGNYPDMGCSVEVFTNADMLELETLSPLTTLPPNSIIEHTEIWNLYKDLPSPETQDDIDEIVRVYL